MKNSLRNNYSIFFKGFYNRNKFSQLIYLYHRTVPRKVNKYDSDKSNNRFRIINDMVALKTHPKPITNPIKDGVTVLAQPCAAPPHYSPLLEFSLGKPLLTNCSKHPKLLKGRKQGQSLRNTIEYCIYNKRRQVQK